MTMAEYEAQQKVTIAEDSSDDDVDRLGNRKMEKLKFKYQEDE